MRQAKMRKMAKRKKASILKKMGRTASQIKRNLKKQLRKKVLS